MSMGVVLLVVVIVVNQGRKMTSDGVLVSLRRRLGMPATVLCMWVMGVPRMRIMRTVGVPRMRIMRTMGVRTMGVRATRAPRMRVMGAPCLIAWSVCLRDSNFSLGGTSLGRCNARRQNAGGKALLDPGDWRSLPVQLLDSRLDIGLNLVGTHSTPVDELRVGATECLQIADGIGCPIRGVVCMKWKKR